MINNNLHEYLLISGHVNRASAIEAVDSSSIPSRVKPKIIKIGIHSFLLDVQQLTGHYEASALCSRQVGKWQHDSKTERSLHCLLAKATWRIQCNFNYNYNLAKSKYSKVLQTALYQQNYIVFFESQKRERDFEPQTLPLLQLALGLLNWAMCSTV